MATGQLIITLIGHSGWVRSVALSQDSKYIVTGSSDNTAKIWDTRYLLNTMTLKELLEHITDNSNQHNHWYNSLCTIV